MTETSLQGSSYIWKGWTLTDQAHLDNSHACVAFKNLLILLRHIPLKINKNKAYTRGGHTVMSTPSDGHYKMSTPGVDIT